TSSPRDRLWRVLTPLARRPARFPHRVGERQDVVVAGPGGGQLPFRTYQVPAAGRGAPDGVLLTQGLRMRCTTRRQRTDPRGGLRVHVRQRGDRGTGTAVAGATPLWPHGPTP